MISSISPLLNLLAPKTAMPATGDPVAFDLVLARLGEPVVGRQIAAPTGKTVPLSADMLAPMSGSPIPLADDEFPNAPPLAPNLPVTGSATSPKPPVSDSRSAVRPRFAEPETCADPVAEPPIAADDAEEADPGLPILPTLLIERDIPVATSPTPVVAERSQTGDPDQGRAPDREKPTTRPTDDEPRPSLHPLPEPAPAPGLVQGPAAPGMKEVAALPVSVPRLTGSASRTPVTARATGAEPLRAPDADRVGKTQVAPTVLAALADRLAPTPASFRRSMTSGRVPDAALKAMMPERVAAPPHFAGSPFRPLPDAATPAARVTAPAAPSASATAVPANPVAVQAAPAVTAPPPSVTTSVEGEVGTIAPSPEPRPDSAEPAVPDRSSAAPSPIATGAPAPGVTRTVMSGSAGQVFAADLRRAPRDPRPVAGETLISPVEAARVDATAAPAAAPLDLRQDRWPSEMVERIQRLRDAVDAVDTRVRLIPDALGAIDVAVRRDGDTVHVHFTAEQAATRALLLDAAPRLAEAAEARGLKLGQTAVGDGGSQPNGRQPQPQADPAPVPASPRPTAAAADEASTDIRIA